MYGRAINGNPPRDTIIWRYRGRGVIGVTFDANGNVDSLETESAEYATRSGIRVGMRIPLGPCHPVTGKCQYRWNGFTCLAFWDGRYDRPFTYTHHAICREGALRIEMDEG